MPTMVSDPLPGVELVDIAARSESKRKRVRCAAPSMSTKRVCVFACTCNKHEFGCVYVRYSCSRTHRRIMGLIRALLSSARDPG
jgi:hypothetical protein